MAWVRVRKRCKESPVHQYAMLRSSLRGERRASGAAGNVGLGLQKSPKCVISRSRRIRCGCVPDLLIKFRATEACRRARQKNRPGNAFTEGIADPRWSGYSASLLLSWEP